MICGALFILAIVTCGMPSLCPSGRCAATKINEPLTRKSSLQARRLLVVHLTFIVSAVRARRALVSRTCSSQHLERAEVATPGGGGTDNSRDQHSIHLTDRYTGEGRAHQVDTLSNYWSSVRHQQPDLSPAISGPGSTSRLLPSGHTFRRDTPIVASGTFFLLESAELIRSVQTSGGSRG